MQWTDQRVPGGQCQLPNNVSLFRHLPGMGEYGVTLSGNLDRTIGTLKDGYTQFLLEFFYLPAEGRLTDKAAFSRFAEMMGLGDCNDVFKISEIHLIFNRC